MTPGQDDTAPPRKKKPPRWGLRTLGFLVLGMIALMTANAQGYSSIGTVGCTVIGLLGAGYCSYRGLRAMNGPGR